MLQRLDMKQKSMLAALLVTLGLSLWVAMQGEQDDAADTIEVVTKLRPANQTSAANRTDSASQSAQSSAGTLPIFAKQNEELAEVSPSVDIFKASQQQQRAMQQAAAAAIESATPAAPEAPPLPFSYLGKLDENGKTVVFLSREQRLYTVHVGEQLDSQYRLDALGNMQLEFTYLPLNTKQTLSMTGAS